MIFQNSIFSLFWGKSIEVAVKQCHMMIFVKNKDEVSHKIFATKSDRVHSKDGSGIFFW